MPRFLIVKLAAIGDVIMGTAMIRALHEKYPGCHITFMVGHAAHGLIALVPGVDRIIRVDDKALLAGSRLQKLGVVLNAWKQIGGERFDGIFIAHTDTRYHLLVTPAFGPRKGISQGMRGTRLRGGLIPGRHHSVEYTRLVTGTDGPAMSAGALPALDPKSFADAHPLPGQTRPYVILAPGGAKNVMRDSPQRRWPTENYATIAKTLLARGTDVILVGANSDNWVLPYFESLPIQNLIGKTDWPGLLALISRAAAILTHDSMMAHLPRFFSTPTIILFGPTPPTSFFAHEPSFHMLQSPQNLPCRPCYDTHDFFDCPTIACMTTIPIPKVQAKLDAILNAN